MGSALTVTQLNTYVRSVLEQDSNLCDVLVVGEISNFVNHYRSGHFYLSLKDNDSLIKAVMFKWAAAKIKFLPENGMKVLCRGRVSLYEKDGTYQLYIEEMTPYGVGDLTVAFEQLKERLQKEGLFSQLHKKQLPKFPSTIAVVTSPTGAAIQDVINVISRRYPICNLLVCPVEVQGENAAKSMIKALNTLSKNDDIDVVIIGRGGGSIEDLWAYNDEILARTIFDFNIPVISAVGHETDFTICDFVSDYRAPTPSAAAEIAVPEIGELKAFISGSKSYLAEQLKRNYKNKQLIFEEIIQSNMFSKPETFFLNRFQELDVLCDKLVAFYKNSILSCENGFKQVESKLSAFNPLGVLKRGYSIVEKGGKPVFDINDIKENDAVSIKFYNGKANAVIKNIE